MILNDQSLWKLANNGLVRPFLGSNVQGSSIDLTLGHSLKIETTSGWADMDLTNGYRLSPGEFALACTHETVEIPYDMCAMLLLRSSAARAGYEHSFSGWCDPGFKGQLTLELKNNLRYRSLKLEPGMRICQLVVKMLDQPAAQQYGQRGNYQNQTGATLSTMKFDREAA